MYVVKLKYKKATEPSYSNKDVIHQVKDIRDPDTSMKLSWFLLKYEEAKKLMMDLISRNNSVNEWYDSEEPLEYIALVDVSHYPPYREYQVVDYKEFK